jgi:hypothetical protein
MEMRAMFLALSSLGKSGREISKITSILRSTVGFILRKHKERKNLISDTSYGRLKALKPKEIAGIIRVVDNCSGTTATIFATSLNNNTGKEIFSLTIGRHLNNSGYKRRTACSKPLLSKQNKKYKIAQKWLCWDVKAWNQVLWSDECKFNILGSDGKQKV